MKLQIIMKIGKVPEGGVVRKLTGKKLYKVFPEISVYGDDGYKRVVKPRGADLFLVDCEGAGSVTSCWYSREVVWLTNSTDLGNHLNKMKKED